MNRIHNVLLLSITSSIALAMPAIALTQETNAAPEYDIVIRGGRVLDGAGNPRIFADVAIKDGRLVKIGRVEGRGSGEFIA